MDEKNILIKNIEEKIQSGREMIEKLNKLKDNVDGIDKLSRKIKQEIKFLEKVRSSDDIKMEYLQSTNLIHLNAVVERLLLELSKEINNSNKKNNQFISVMKPFKMGNDNSRLLVDIITDCGNTWIKVIARNPKALTLISRGNCEYGQKSVLDQAASFLQCATIHPHCYKIPNIIFHFASGIESVLAWELKQLGILVEDKVIGNDNTDGIINESSAKNSENSHSSKEYNQHLSINNRLSSLRLHENNDNILTDDNMDIVTTKLLNVDTLNLDVSTLLSYVSNMTNGHANFIYLEPLLTLQAEAERKRAIKSILDKWFVEKQLLICKTAYDNFMDIIRFIGGINETMRANTLMKRVRIIEDPVNSDNSILTLTLGGKIKHRSRLVFATGESTKSITVSANEGFVRAARMQGVECAVILHEPRSLSEIKEKYATKINDNFDTNTLR